MSGRGLSYVAPARSPSPPLGMGSGALCLILLSAGRGGLTVAAAFEPAQWLAVAYLGVFGGAAIFCLWAFALGRTKPTRVAVSVTINPVTASLVGAGLLGEPRRWNLLAGLAMVALGIGIATMGRRQPAAATDAADNRRLRSGG
ncbi:EamA family transporter [Azospirillum doebereinerae]